MIVRLYDDMFLQHGVPWHPENAQRLRAITERLHDDGLWHEMSPVEFEPATQEQLLRVHEEWYLDDLRDASQAGGEAWDTDTIATDRTWEVACLAAGACTAAAELVTVSPDTQALCLVRPPGHHALPTRAMGFCFLNNTALAVEAAVQSGAQRVAVFDCDVHHGNGVQDIFYNRGDVLYMSIHQTDLFPGTGTVDELGLDAGFGLNVNVPLPQGARAEHYRRAWEELFAPLTRRFAPDLIILDMGYDTHWRDPLGNMALCADAYHEITSQVLAAARESCAGRLQIILEGGYHAPSLARGVENTVLALLGEPLQEPDEPAPAGAPEQIRRVEEHLEHALGVHRERLGI
ncbi:MAG TPA: histone deacetylase [Armatimonadota bacterium]|jgi:acetoin utilization deacetylase AcuC-like enzyme